MTNLSRVQEPLLFVLLLLVLVPMSLSGQGRSDQTAMGHFEQLLEESGIGVVRDEMHRLLAEPEGASAMDLSELIAFGRRLHESGKVNEAVAVLQLTVEAFPESPRAHMSLGDAWEAKGDVDRQAIGYGDALDAIDQTELRAYLRENANDLPRTAQDVIDRHLDAIGGRKALDEILTMEMRYSGHDDAGESGIIVRQYRHPHYVRQYAVGSDYAIVTDGSTTWRVKETAWTELEGGDSRHRPDMFHDLIDFANKGISYAYWGAVAEDGIVFHQLRKTYADGYFEDYFFAATTGLLTRIASRSVIGATETHYWDYANEGGMLLPHVFIVAPLRYDGVHGGTVREVILNPPLADSLFLKP